jgi:hypothetical protein
MVWRRVRPPSRSDARSTASVPLRLGDSCMTLTLVANAPLSRPRPTKRAARLRCGPTPILRLPFFCQLLLSTSLHPRPSICLRSRAVGCTAWHPTSGWRVPTSHRRITCTHTSPLLSHRSTSLGSRNMAARKRTINTGRTFILRERVVDVSFH